MTTDEQHRLLGQLALGVSTETALSSLGPTAADLERQKTTDPAFAVAYGLVTEVSAEFVERMLQRFDRQ